MRKYSKKELSKRRIVAYSVTALLFLIAVIIPFLPDIFPDAAYEELNEKKMTVEYISKSHYFRGGDIYRIHTEDGRTYNISGRFECEDIKDVLVEGTDITLKWYRRFPVVYPLAEEVSAYGNVIVSYDNDEPIERGGLIFFSAITLLIAVMCLAFNLLWTKHLQRLQNMRDKRIDKKYGKNKD